MEKLFVMLILIGCAKLPESSPANAFVIGVLHDPLEDYVKEVAEAIHHIEQLYPAASNNITVRAIALTLDSNWTVCQVINSSSVALVAVGSCHFHYLLSLRLESHLPVAIVRVEMDTPCNMASWDSRVFSATSRYQWLPYVVMDTLTFLSSNQLMIVVSAPYIRIASGIARFLSAQNVKHAILSGEQFLDPLFKYGLTSSDLNSSSPVFLAVSEGEVELILSKSPADTRYWLVFCEDYFSFVNSSYATSFFIVPSLSFMKAHNNLKLDGQGTKIYITLQSVLTSFLQLSMPSSHVHTLPCGEFNISVSKVARQLSNHLSQHVFDKHGFLAIDQFDIMNPDAGGFEVAGHWNTSAGLTMSSQVTTTITKMSDFTNKTLIIGTEVAHPFVFYENGTWSGFCFDMLKELAFRMGFKYKIVPSVDKMWGATNPDGTWNGLVGMATRNEIDMAVGPISVTADRETVVDFTKPYMESAAGMLMRRFEDTIAKMFRTLMPFTTNVWLTLGGLVVVIGLVFGLINRFSPSANEPMHGDSDRWIASMGDSAWVVFGSFMEQGAEKFPRGVAGRIVLGLWWVFTILTTASYTASLAAFLTFSLADVPINSIYDLAHQSQVLPLVKNGTNLFSLFKKGETSTYRKIYEMMQQAPLVQTNQEGMAMVMSGPYALLTDREQLDLLQKEDCKMLVQAKEHFNNNGLAFFVQKGSPLLKPLSMNIIKLMEAGLIDKWRRKWWSAKDVCGKEVKVSSVQSLKLDSTAGPFILYASTTVLALIVLQSERIANKLWPVCRALFTRRPLEV